MEKVPGGEKISDETPQTEGPREKFLLAMYVQLWNNINRHVLLVWQPVTTLGATLALLSLVEKKVFGLDIATSLSVIVSTWLIAHTLDASTWFRRNQEMIGYIESVFLTNKDKEGLGPFVGVPPSSKKPILYFRIQAILGYSVMALMITHHLVQRVHPAFVLFGQPDFSKWMPYGCVAASLVCIFIMNRQAQLTHS